MNVLLTGATGFLGRNIAEALQAVGHSVLPISRRQGVDVQPMQSPDDWLPWLEDIDAVINCLGIIGESGTQRFNTLHRLVPTALFHACHKAGVRRVVQISALGADESAFSAYHLSKRAADDALRHLDLDWFVLRPSLVYGRGGASTGLFMRLAALPLIPVVADGQQRLQPVHISDLVAAVMHCLGAQPVRQTLDIVGSEVVTFADWLLFLRKAQRLPAARFLHIPKAAALAFTHLVRSINPMMQPDNLRMLDAGSCASVEPFADFLGRMPHGLEQQLVFADGASKVEAT